MRVLASVLVLAPFIACGGRAASPPATGPTGPATAPPAAASTSLSLLVADGGGCAWQRLDVASGRATTIARLPVGCAGGRVAWSPDLARAVVSFDPARDPESTVAGAPRAFVVTVAGGAVSPLPPPVVADPIEEYAIGEDGAVLAFATHDFPEMDKPVVEYLGARLSFVDLSEGMPAAAIVHRHGEAGWELVEVVETTTGWDYAMGWQAARRAERIGPRSEGLLDARQAGDELADPALRAALEALSGAPGDERDGWGVFGDPPLYAWRVTGEFTYPTAMLAWRGASGAIERAPEPLGGREEIVTLTRAGALALVVRDEAGAARLYDVAARRVVFRSEAARAVVFWPAPGVAR